MRLWFIYDQITAVCINTPYCVVGYRTSIVVNHEKEAADWGRKQRVQLWDCTLYTIELLQYGPFGAVCVWLCYCVCVWPCGLCVRLVVLVCLLCVYMRCCQTKQFPVGWVGRILLGLLVQKSLTGNCNWNLTISGCIWYSQKCFGTISGKTCTSKESILHVIIQQSKLHDPTVFKMTSY